MSSTPSNKRKAQDDLPGAASPAQRQRLTPQRAAAPLGAPAAVRPTVSLARTVGSVSLSSGPIVTEVDSDDDTAIAEVTVPSSSTSTALAVVRPVGGGELQKMTTTYGLPGSALVTIDLNRNKKARSAADNFANVSKAYYEYYLNVRRQKAKLEAIKRNDARDLYGEQKTNKQFLFNLVEAYGASRYNAAARKNPGQISYERSDAPNILRQCLWRMLPRLAWDYKQFDLDNGYDVARISDIHAFDGMALACCLDGIVLPSSFINRCNKILGREVTQRRVPDSQITSGFCNALTFQAMEGLLETQRRMLINPTRLWEYPETDAISGDQQLRDAIVNTTLDRVFQAGDNEKKEAIDRLDELKFTWIASEQKEISEEQKIWFRWDILRKISITFGSLTGKAKKYEWGPEISQVQYPASHPDKNAAPIRNYARCEPLALAFEAHMNLQPFARLADLFVILATEFATGGSVKVGNKPGAAGVISNLSDLNREGKRVYDRTQRTEVRNMTKKEKSFLLRAWQTVRKQKSQWPYMDCRDCFFRDWANEHYTFPGEVGYPTTIPYLRAYEKDALKSKAAPYTPQNLRIDPLIAKTARDFDTFLTRRGLISWEFAQFAWALLKYLEPQAAFEGLRDIRPLFDYIYRMIDTVWVSEIKNKPANRSVLYDVLGPIILAVSFVNRPIQMMSVYALWVRFALYLQYSTQKPAVSVNDIHFAHEHEGKTDANNRASAMLKDWIENVAEFDTGTIAAFFAGVRGHKGIRNQIFAKRIAYFIQGTGSELDPKDRYRAHRLTQSEQDIGETKDLAYAETGYATQYTSLIGEFPPINKQVQVDKEQELEQFIVSYKYEFKDTRVQLAGVRPVSTAPAPATRERLIGTIQEKSVGIVAQIFHPQFGPSDVKTEAEQRLRSHNQRVWIYPDGTRRFTFAGPDINAVGFANDDVKRVRAPMQHMDINLHSALYVAEYAVRTMTPAATIEKQTTDTDGTRSSILAEELAQIAEALAEFQEEQTRLEIDAVKTAGTPQSAINVATASLMGNAALGARTSAAEMQQALATNDKKLPRFRVHPDRLYWDVFLPREPDTDWAKKLEDGNIVDMIPLLARNSDTMQVTFHMINQAGDAFIIESQEILEKIQSMLWATFDDEKGGNDTKRQITKATDAVLTPLTLDQVGQFSDIVQLADQAQDKTNGVRGTKDSWRAANYRWVKSCFILDVLPRKETLPGAYAKLPAMPWIRDKRRNANIVADARRFAANPDPRISFDTRIIVKSMQTALALDQAEREAVPIQSTPMISSVGEVLDRINATTLVQNTHSAINYGRDFRARLLDVEEKYYDMPMRRMVARFQKRYISLQAIASFDVNQLLPRLAEIMEPFRVQSGERMRAFVLNTNIVSRTATIQKIEDKEVPKLNLFSTGDEDDNKQLGVRLSSQKKKGGNGAEIPENAPVQHPLLSKPDALRQFMIVGRVLAEACNLIFTDFKMNQVMRAVVGDVKTEEKEDPDALDLVTLSDQDALALALKEPENENTPASLRAEFSSKADVNPSPNQHLRVFTVGFTARVAYLVRVYNQQHSNDPIQFSAAELRACEDIAGRYVYPVVVARVTQQLPTNNQIFDLVQAVGSFGSGSASRLALDAPVAIPNEIEQTVYEIVNTFFAAFYQTYVKGTYLLFEEDDDLQDRIAQAKSRRDTVEVKQLDEALAAEEAKKLANDRIELSKREDLDEDGIARLYGPAIEKSEAFFEDSDAVSGNNVLFERGVETWDIMDIIRLFTPITSATGSIDWIATVAWWKVVDPDRNLTNINLKRTFELMARFSRRLINELESKEQRPWGQSFIEKKEPRTIYDEAGTARNVCTLRNRVSSSRDSDLEEFKAAVARLMENEGRGDDGVIEKDRYRQTYLKVKSCILSHNLVVNYFDDVFKSKYAALKSDDLVKRLAKIVPEYLDEKTEQQLELLEPKQSKNEDNDAKDVGIELTSTAAEARAATRAILVKQRNGSKKQKAKELMSEEEEGAEFMAGVFDYRDVEGERALACYNILLYLTNRWEGAQVESIKDFGTYDEEKKRVNNQLLRDMRSAIDQGWGSNSNAAVRLRALQQVRALVLRHAQVFIEAWLVPTLEARIASVGVLQNSGSEAKNLPKSAHFERHLARVREEVGDFDDNDPEIARQKDNIRASIRLARRIHKRIEADPQTTFGLFNLLAYLSQVYDGQSDMAPLLLQAQEEIEISASTTVAVRMDTSLDAPSEEAKEEEEEEEEEEESLELLEEGVVDFSASDSVRDEYQRTAEKELKLELAQKGDRKGNRVPVELPDPPVPELKEPERSKFIRGLETRREQINIIKDVLRQTERAAFQEGEQAQIEADEAKARRGRARRGQ